MCDASNPSFVLERVDYDAFGMPLFSNLSGAPLLDAVGRVLAESSSRLTRLHRGPLYFPEFGQGTAERAMDWGDGHGAGGTCGDPDTDRPVSLNGLPPGEPSIR